MPVGPPIRPRIIDMRAYERRLRSDVLGPLMQDVQRNLAQAGNSWDAVVQVLGHQLEDPSLHGRAEEVAGSQLGALQSWHRKRFARAMNRLIGVRPSDIPDLRGGPFIDDRTTVNVSLIKTIPPRLHQKLRDDIASVQKKTPFDRAVLNQLLRKSYGSAGYNLRRLTRDQTSKTVGGLNEVRQKGVGVTHYRWLTSNDARVRDTHRLNHGRIFSWDDPPPETGHPGTDIQCRCVALPVVGPMPPQNVIQDLNDYYAMLIGEFPASLDKDLRQLVAAAPQPLDRQHYEQIRERLLRLQEKAQQPSSP